MFYLLVSELEYKLSFVINKAIGHCSDFAANYLDDIIVFSRTAEDHMEHLVKIFEALQVADLKIKVSNVSFSRSTYHL